MQIDKSLQTGSTAMLILKLIETQDMYGYQMIETLAKMSNNVFELKAGTLYPLLKMMEDKGLITSYEQNADSQRVRKYYHITKNGTQALCEKQHQWQLFSETVNEVLKGGASLAFA